MTKISSILWEGLRQGGLRQGGGGLKQRVIRYIIFQ